MTPTISDLWYGNIAPSEHCGAHDSQLNQLLVLMERHKKSLSDNISPRQAEILQKYIDCSDEFMLHMAELAFTEGFSLACRLLCESLIT